MFMLTDIYSFGKLWVQCVTNKFMCMTQHSQKKTIINQSLVMKSNETHLYINSCRSEMARLPYLPKPC